ncbi:hypothetical protein AURDEDRAFT_166198 [Auricularia subglabra TFB-10046 SS5]|nr:hypothetical protein AURDEDRAFT_166198 [Auricularia subglabra TFB-10046 SS5]
MFYHQGSVSTPKLTLFFVSSSRRGQTLVSHYGRTTHDGKWTCRKCTAQPCDHVSTAKKHDVFEILFQDKYPDADASAVSEEDDIEETAEERAERLSSASEHDERSVSHLPVGPPTWARLSSDTAPTFKPIRSNPGHLPLGPDPRCRCGQRPDPSSEKKIIHQLPAPLLSCNG